MKKIAYIGFGEVGKHTAFHLREHYGNEIQSEIYFDDYLIPKKDNVFSFAEYLNDDFAEYDFYVCLGYKHLHKRREIITKLYTHKRKMPPFIHKSTYVHSSAIIEEGVIISPNCLIDRNVTLKKGIALNNASVISHDSYIEECCFFGASVTVSGYVNIGTCSFIGSGTIISNNLNIGQNVHVGIGSVVTKSISDNTNCIGNPLKILKSPLNLI